MGPSRSVPKKKKKIRWKKKEFWGKGVKKKKNRKKGIAGEKKRAKLSRRILQGNQKSGDRKKRTHPKKWGKALRKKNWGARKEPSPMGVGGGGGGAPKKQSERN